jgi:hypothetical protein
VRTQRLGAAVAAALGEGHRMRSRAKVMTTTTRRPSSRVASIRALRTLPARLLTRLLDALQESQIRRACRELHRYRHLIQNDQSPGCACRGDAPIWGDIGPRQFCVSANRALSRQLE